MSSAQAQQVFQQSDYVEPLEGQTDFANQFDLAQPNEAMTSYQKLMHQHTKQQFELAAESSRRRSSASSSSHGASLHKETSNASVSSTSS
nr:hypothetical protein CFP56_30175 [Quercus suber]